MSGRDYPDNAETLRQQLEHLELQQEDVPTPRPSAQRRTSSGWQQERAAGGTPASYAPRDPNRTNARIRFSDELPRGRPSVTRPSLNRDSQLYTIRSNADDGRLPAAWEGAAQSSASTAPTEASSSKHLGPQSLDDARHSAASSYNHIPVSIAHARHHGDGFDGNLKDAIVTAAETNVTLAHYRDWVARQRERRRRWTRGPLGRTKACLARLYKRFVVEGVLRQKPVQPNEDGRHIPVEPGLARRAPLVDERTGKPYVSNHIRSSRYTLWDFLPKQLFFQFSKLANFYLLLVGIMQMIPGLSTTGTYTTIAPLLAFVALSMGKEGFDDYRRYRLDKVENRKDAWVLDPARTIGTRPPSRGAALKKAVRRKRSHVEVSLGMTELQRISTCEGDDDSWSRAQWQEVRVGDIVRLRRDEDVPADMVLLHATGPNGVAYIETMALDGETNLKSKQASSLLVGKCASPALLSSCGVTVVAEDPNLDLYNFQGRATVDGNAVPLTSTQVIYRGSTLRNTDRAIGLIINTGEECKIRMNANKNLSAKAPAMQKIVNRIVVLLILFVVMLSFGCAIGYEVWKGDYKPDAWYLRHAGVSFKEIIIGFIIAFNTIIPLSLYVSLEIIKLGQFLLLQDVDMYDPETDTPMIANTTTILENLGQVSYVFSDKTGTLTENVMRFRKMSVAGTAWLHDRDVREEAGEEDRRRRASLEQKEKGKQKAERRSFTFPRPSRTSRSDRVSGEVLYGAAQGEAETDPAAGAGPVSQWRSTARPGLAQPLLRTEDLMRYLGRKPRTAFSRKARHFALCIALCHTCLPETSEGGDITYQAASPDELALVDAARELGYVLVDRPPESMKLQVRDPDGSGVTTQTYEVLDVIEFSSKRKRMSIIIRMPDGRICMFTKGADSAILPRLKLSGLAAQKASAVEDRASKRKSVEQEKALQRRSTQRSTRDSFSMARAAAGMGPRRSGLRNRSSKRSSSMHRRSLATEEVDSWLTRRETEDREQAAMDGGAYRSPRASLAAQRPTEPAATEDDPCDGMVDERLATNEGAVFERCFQHIDDFASEGLRTLLYAYRYLDEEEYKKWRPAYQEAATSLVDRQRRIEAASELIEQGFELAGVTAIEDKLQKGVPETIDKLRRANIKVWMLTGDKRETAINIAHSARLCKPYSEMYILDATKGDLQESIASTLIEVGRGMIPHSVVVIDGHTLGVVEEDESLRILLFDLVARVDSVICCRASPSQKATLVQCIRHQVPSSITLAIGDGANDIAMIQASHVGIGLSGREGLQAARIADYAIAQFRFLQKLLLVHGRWNYVRTGKYILGTFWKEIVFYLVQAQYQRYNGYTGTSMFESTSLTVFNTLFTSLPVILHGIFEQDLRAETLLAVPELYAFGQRNLAFSFRLYVWWMFMAAGESVMIFSIIRCVYGSVASDGDDSLYALGTLAFSVCIIFVNTKMLVLETHNQTAVTLGGWVISVGGWFLWDIFLSAIYSESYRPYLVRHGFLENFGREWAWWLTVIIALSAVVAYELAVAAVRRVFRPWDRDLMQELEHDEGLMEVMREHAAERGELGDGGAGSAQAEARTGAPNEGGAAAPDKGKCPVVVTATEVATTAWGANGTEPGAVSGNRGSRLLTNDYIPPPITSPMEEGEDPAELQSPSNGTGAGRDKTAAEPLIDTSRAAGGAGLGDLAHSPVEMRSPTSGGPRGPGQPASP